MPTDITLTPTDNDAVVYLDDNSQQSIAPLEEHTFTLPPGATCTIVSTEGAASPWAHMTPEERAVAFAEHMTYYWQNTLVTAQGAVRIATST